MSKRALTAALIGIALVVALALSLARADSSGSETWTDAKTDAGARAPHGESFHHRGEKPPPAAGRPNFLVVMVDDQALNSFRRDVQPKTFSHLIDQGTAFKSSYATPPLCCPARAAFQTGQYPHNNGVLGNDYGLLRDPANTLGSWMQESGYQTGFIGKYMNEYESTPGTAGGVRPAPGYDRWWSFVGKPGYYDYEISDDGSTQKFAEAPEDHSTSQITELSKEFITERASAGEPFFLWTSYYSPHIRSGGPDSYCDKSVPIPEPRDEEKWLRATLPKGPAYDELSNADKPPQFSHLPRLSETKKADILRRYRCTLQSMAGVDRGVAALDRTLQQSGVRRDTIVIYLSDNGYFFGEHRIPKGKVWPYDPSSRVPWAVRVPNHFLGGERAPKVIKAPVGTIDLAPTILDFAGASPCVRNGSGEKRCRVLDGRSISPLLHHEKWKKGRGLLLQIGKDCNGYSSVRSPRYLYGEYYAPAKKAPQGEPRLGNDGTEGCREIGRELYEIREDPNQLHNLLGEPPVSREDERLAARLHARLTQLRGCSGTARRSSGASDSCR